ncbi:Bax inhibitor-1/YccA family protein [Nonlabens ponticola]|uniref:Permease n=1 Tax=Nonlabens ponticola TaxID=2496866 RepID=A0A3S9N069_9FLAO|nr:Bax inhibitor-1 family protein [Nonlabens ponticola]AZQ44764.1 permease [Nonlabens ponticola]
MQPTEFKQTPSKYQPLIEVDDTTRATFYRKTYTHVALAVLLFIVLETMLLRIDPLVELMLSLAQGWTWLLVLGGFMFATSYAEKLAHTTHDKTTQYGALFLFVLAEAIIFVPLVYIALFYGEMEYFSTINQAAIMTLALFTGLSAVVLLTKKDFSFLRSFLAIGFVIAIGAIIAGMIFGFNLGLVFSAGMVVLAAGTILYQTSQLVHKYDTDQYVGASLGLFASLMLLFWYVLSIFMGRD